MIEDSRLFDEVRTLRVEVLSTAFHPTEVIVVHLCTLVLQIASLVETLLLALSVCSVLGESLLRCRTYRT